ncbi:acyl-CoA thioesterase [Nocardioides dongkuii]|uniref:acyl-CoA thioesterase n=1 Tax=Nocardioides dongkuii TaxID=2760089 RepID=UPI0015F7CEC9|nr:acyl-CoA thioesterase II [Nocardioides dongkuii]
MPRDADALVALLDLEKIDDDLFRGATETSLLPRVYGGQVAAQALVAATRTVDPAYAVHSLHSYFLQPGDPAAPIIYDVENLRDGRSFATRRVLGRQHGRPIFALTASFQVAEEGWAHQDVMPQVTSPEDSIDPREAMAELDPDRDTSGDSEWDVAALRYVGSSGDGRLAEDAEHPAVQRCWLKVSSALPDDPLLHAAAFTYLSDMFLIGAALVPHGARVGDGSTLVASLDHTIWFHRPFRADEWWLYDQTSPFAGGGRGLVTAGVFTQDGTLVATVAQEALLRKFDPSRVRR